VANTTKNIAREANASLYQKTKALNIKRTVGHTETREIILKSLGRSALWGCLS